MKVQAVNNSSRLAFNAIHCSNDLNNTQKIVTQDIINSLKIKSLTFSNKTGKEWLDAHNKDLWIERGSNSKSVSVYMGRNLVLDDESLVPDKQATVGHYSEEKPFRLADLKDARTSIFLENLSFIAMAIFSLGVCTAAVLYGKLNTKRQAAQQNIEQVTNIVKDSIKAVNDTIKL